MAKEKDNQEEVKELTYKDCVWYMADIDRCRLPGCCERFMECISKREGKMGDFCIWVTEFMAPTSTDIADGSKEVQLELFNLDDPFGFGGESELAPESYMDGLVKKIYDKLQKLDKEKETNA